MPVNRPQPISREDIAEIHEQRALIIMEQARGPWTPGVSIHEHVGKAVAAEKQAIGYREIDGLEDKRNLDEHVWYTQEAWDHNKKKKREQAARDGLAKAATILKVVT